MYLLTWHITIGKFRVQTLKSVKITTSVLNLSDTAVMEMPGQYLNTWLDIEKKIAVGDAVSIALGYDGNNQSVFNGYLKRISRDSNSLKLECEDSLYLLYKSIADKEYKQVTVTALLKDILRQVDTRFTVDCDYEYTMEKLVAFHTTALDVVKKIQSETKANIWFENTTLHVHPVYSERAGETPELFDTQINVQKNDLKWIDQADKKVQIEVVYNKPDGEKEKETYGTEGGEKITKYVSGNNSSEMKTIAENEYNLWNYSGFEGSFTAWLIPRVTAGGSVRLRDNGRPEGKYYVTGVEIEFGQNGAKQIITLGRKLD